MVPSRNIAPTACRGNGRLQDDQSKMFDWEREMEPVKNPLRPAVRIAPFFVLNDELREERLGQMMRECAGAGFDSVILHPRDGERLAGQREGHVDRAVRGMEYAVALRAVVTPAPAKSA